MKICFLFNHLNYADGVARSVISISNILAEQGHQITLIPLYGYETKIKRELRDDIRIQPVLKKYFRGLSKVLNLIPSIILYKAIVREEYDFEVAFQYGISTKIIATSQNKNAKHYCWMHGYDEGLLFKRFYLKMDTIFCVSKQNAKRLRKELGEMVEYCYNPIDDKYICELSRESIEFEKGKEIVFVSVGRHSKEKGYIRLLECIHRLLDEGYRFKVWLIGDGPEHKVLIEKAIELGIENSVFFMGNQSNPHAYTVRADCFICSSFSEGYSTACVEAVMLNIPVLTTAVSGAEEIILDAEAGMVVGMSDDQIYRGMKKILDNPKILEEWKRTLQITKGKFSYETRKKKILEIFS